MSKQDSGALPVLPNPPLGFAIGIGDDGTRLDYSANDMRAYAQAARTKALFEAAEIVAGVKDKSGVNDDGQSWLGFGGPMSKVRCGTERTAR